MRTSPPMRRACRSAAACAVLLAAAHRSGAQSLELRHPTVPDSNPPAASTLGVPCLADFSAPTAAANILGFLDSQSLGPHGHWNAGGVTGGPLQPLPGPEIAEHLSWFMATNSRRDSSCAAGAVDTWGRTNARTGGIAGTRNSDLAPGIVEFVRWDAGLYPFLGPVPRPGLPAGKTAYDWRMKTFLNPHSAPTTRPSWATTRGTSTPSRCSSRSGTGT